MKKLLLIVCLSFLVNVNSYATEWNKFFLDEKKGEENLLYNTLIKDFNNYITDVYTDNSCRSISMTVTYLIDFTDCVYRNIKKYMKRNNVNVISEVVDAEHDVYTDLFERAKSTHLKWSRGNQENMEEEYRQFNRHWKKVYTDKNFYLKKVWKEYAELEQLKFSALINDVDKKKDQVQSGSGFFINNKGYFVTNNHVIEGCKQSKITFKDQSIDAEVIAKDQNLDLALLKAKVRSKEFLNLSSDPPKKLQKIYVAGYPFGKGLSDDLKFTQGIISSVKGFADNSNQIQIDAAINSGNSGGPIVNEDGDLIAVAVSGLDKSASEGIGFGIKANSVINFLEVNDIKYSTSSLLNFGMNSNKLNDLLEKSTVYTFCN